MFKTNKNSIGFAFAMLAVLALGLSMMPIAANAQVADDGYDHFLAPSQNPIPQLYSISPSSANAGDNLTTITITGHGFTQNSVARWNGVNRSTIFIDKDHLLMRLQPGDLNDSNGRYVNVFNPNRNAYSNAAFFAISGYVASNNAPVNNNYNTGTQANQNGYYDQNGNYVANGNNGNMGNNSGTYMNTTNGTRMNQNETVGSLASNAIFGTNSFMPTGLIQWVLFAIIIVLIILIVRRFTGATERYHHSPLKHN